MTLIEVASSPHLPRRLRRTGALTVAEWEALSPAQRQRVLRHGLIPPIAGGMPEGDDAGGDGDDSGGDGDGDDDTAGSGDDDTAGAGGGDDDDSGDGDVATARAEAERQKRRADQAEKKARTLEREAQQQKRKQQESAGEYERLYTEEKESHAKTIGKVKAKTRDAAIIVVAERMNFIDPQLAVDLVASRLDAEELVDDDFDVDEKPIEKALKDRIKNSKVTLVKETERQSGDAGRGDRDRAAGRSRRIGSRDEDDADTDSGLSRLTARQKLRRYHEDQAAAEA